MASQRDVITELVNEIGILIKLRLSAYIEKYADGSTAQFVNPFIVCPELDEFHASSLRPAIQAKMHLQEQLSNELFEIDVEQIRFDDELKLILELIIIPLFFHDDELEFIPVTFGDGFLTSNKNRLYLFFNAYDDVALSEAKQKVRIKSTFDALKSV